MDAHPVAEPPATSLDLLSTAREGSQEAGRRLMAEYGPSMVRTAWSVLGGYGASEADDVVQEAFIAALTTTALPRGDLGAWLRAITVRKALDSVRRFRRRGEQPLSPPRGAPLDRGLDAGGGPSDRVEVLALRQALARLSRADRAVLTLVDLEGWTMAEAAGVLGVTHVAVRLRAVRARRKLARLLRPLRAPAGAPSDGARGAR